MIAGAVPSYAGDRGRRHDDGPRREAPDPIGTKDAPAGRPAVPGQAAENGSIRVRRRGGRAGKIGESAAGRPCAVSVMDRRRGYAVHTSSERMTECI